MRLSAEKFREKLIELADRIKADNLAKKKLESLSEKELNKIQKNAMKLIPYYKEEKVKTGGRRKKTKRTRGKKNRTRKLRGGVDIIPLGLLILAGGIYFFREWISDIFTSEEELIDRRDRQRYQAATARLNRQRRRLEGRVRSEAWDAMDAGVGGG